MVLNFLQAIKGMATADNSYLDIKGGIIISENVSITTIRVGDLVQKKSGTIQKIDNNINQLILAEKVGIALESSEDQTTIEILWIGYS